MRMEDILTMRAGRDDRVNRFLRLPLPEPYVPTRLEAARDRLRTRPGKSLAAGPTAKTAKTAKVKPKTKPKVKTGSKAKKKPARTAVDDRRRQSADAPDRAARGAGHHGGRQRQPSRRARTLEGQRYG